MRVTMSRRAVLLGRFTVSREKLSSMYGPRELERWVSFGPFARFNRGTGWHNSSGSREPLLNLATYAAPMTRLPGPGQVNYNATRIKHRHERVSEKEGYMKRSDIEESYGE